MARIKNNGTIISTDYQFAKLIDRSIENVVIPSNINAIKAHAFYYCSQLKEVYIPKNIKTIGESAFYQCTSLNILEFENDSVTSIEANAFVGCSSIEKIIFPESFISVGSAAFRSCSNLKKVVFPKTFIGFANYLNFDSCSSLLYVFFRGDSGISGGATRGAFGACNNMHLFDMRYMQSAKDKASGNTFTANNVYLYINVPDSLYSQFTDATICPNWNALSLKRFVHSCDVASFEEIQSPIDGDYYSLKGDTNYLNPLGQKQIDIRQYVNGAWVEIDIG